MSQKALVIVTCLVVLLSLGAYTYMNTDRILGKLIEQKKPETILLIAPNGPPVDIIRPEEGSIVVNFKATEADMNVGDTPLTRIQLFRSRKVTGLAINYLYEEQAIAGGLPVIKTPKIALLDGAIHQIAYTYKKGENQSLYIDGNRVAWSRYFPEKVYVITGFAVKGPENELSTEKGELDSFVLERAMGEEEILAMQSR